MPKFIKGNQFWKLRSEHGRDKLFETPELLWEAATEYFNWIDGHPWYRVENKNGKLVKVPLVRPYTITAFLTYIDASESYWRDFKAAEHSDFSSVISTIENIMNTQKIEGALVGAFNGNIVSRLIGLKDKMELTGKDDSELISSKSDDELKALLAVISAKL